MATEKVTRNVLLVASEEIGSAASKVLNSATGVHAQAVTGPRSALGAIAALKPHFIVFEAGRVPVPAMQAVKNMAELATSRKVPVLIVCGPVDNGIEQQRDSLGIVEVLDEPYESVALLHAIQALVEKFEQARRDSQMRQQKQQQIRERLRTASDKYAAMSAEAASERLAEKDPPSDVQDFASDDAAPPAEDDPRKPPNEPTWDGSGL